MIIICILIGIGCLIAGGFIGFIFGARKLGESWTGGIIITLRKRGYSEHEISDILEEVFSVPSKEGIAIYKQIEKEA